MHEVFSLLELEMAELMPVKRAVDLEDEEEALIQLKEYYRKRQNYAGFLFDKNKKNLGEVMKAFRQIPEEEKTYIFQVCDQLANDIFLFREPWDMERTNIPYQFNEGIDWEAEPANDPEWTFMINRHNFLNCLAQAYLLTEDSKFTAIYVRLIKDWLKKNPGPNGFKITSWRSIDSGIRLRNWIKSLEVFLLDSSFPPKVLADIIVSVKRHLDYLGEGLQIERMQTNWVVLECNGAYLATEFFSELKLEADYVSTIKEYVNEASQSQITVEGMHWEQSYQYHHEVLLKLAEIYLIAKRNNAEIPPNLKDTLIKMATVSAWIKKPDGRQDNYGDSDSEYLEDLLLCLEQLLEIQLLSSYSGIYPNRFVLGHYGIISKIERKNRSFDASHALEEPGIYLLKNSENKVHAQFKCGFLGHGHGHDDLLHLAIFADDEDILVDSGRYNYEEAHHNRLLFKAQTSHNTTIVDGIPIHEHKNCWDAKKVPTDVNTKFRFSEEADFVEGGHLGYLDLEDSLFTNRKVLFFKPDIFIVVDEFLGKGNHQFEQNYIFNSENLEKLDESTVLYRNSKGKKYYIENFYSTNEGGNVTINKHEVSKDYNDKYSVAKATFSAFEKAPFIMTTIINLSGQQLSVEPVEVLNEYGVVREKNIVSAYKIDNKKYVVINHQEDSDSRRAYLVDGHHVYGRVVTFEIDQQGNKIKVNKIY